MRFVSCIFFIWLIPFFASANQFDVFEENGKVGLKNDQGKILIPAQYEALGWSDGSFSLVDKVTGYKLNNQWGLISIENKRVTKADFTELFPAESSLIIGRKKSNLSMRYSAGCITSSGKQVVPFLYDGLKISGLRIIAFLKTGNRYNYGLFDLENKMLIPLNYANIYPLGSLRFAVENFDHKISIFSENGKQLSGFAIDSISHFQKNYAVFHQGENQGLIDREGQIRIEAKYREIKIENEQVYSREADAWLFVEGQNRFLREYHADSVVVAGPNLFKVEQSGRVRFTDAQFHPVGEESFSHIGRFKNGKALIIRNGKSGLIRKNGFVALVPRYDELRWTNTYVLASERQGSKNKWTILDTLGNRVTTKLYDRVEDFNSRFFPAELRGYWGGVDMTGKEIIACVYDSIVQALGDYVVVKFKGNYGIINLREAWVITPQPNFLQLIAADRYLEFAPAQRFLKSIDGRTIYFSENRIEPKAGYLLEYLSTGTLWKIDMQGLIVDRQAQPEEPIERIFPESEGLRGIQRNGKFGFVDSRGRLRIANRYEDIGFYQEGLAPAKIRGRWGFINHRDEIAIQPAYDEVSPFKDGFSMVKAKGLSGIIDKTGKQVLPVRYERVEILPGGRVLVMSGGVFGLSDASGKMLIQPRYDLLIDTNNGYAIVRRDKKFGIVTLQGISTVPMIYDSISYNPYDNFFIALKRSEWVAVKF